MKILRRILAMIIAFTIASPVAFLYAIHVTVDFLVVDRVWADWLMTKAEAVDDWGAR